MRARNNIFRESAAEREARFASIAAGTAFGDGDDAPRTRRSPAPRKVDRRRKAAPAAVTRHEARLLFTARPHQEEARDAIVAARAEGSDSFILGDETGVGKTLSAWLAVAGMAERTLLVVAPPGALPQWRRTLLGAGEPSRPKVFKLTTYDSLASLLDPLPRGIGTLREWRLANAATAPFKRRWAIVILDECHRMRNQATFRARMGARLVAQADFALYLSATAAETPRQLHYLAPLLERAAGLAPGGRDVATILRAAMPPRPEDESERDRVRAERAAVASLLYTGPTPAGLRRRTGDIAGWPAVRRELAPTALDEAARAAYDGAWDEYASSLVAIRRRESRGRDVGADAMERRGADMLFRKKASILRVPGTLDFVEDLVEAGLQVAVSVFFLDSARAIAAGCAARGIRCAAITGGASARRNEEERVAFQTGRASVIVSTATESISLHQGEMPGGEKVRATAIHDLRINAIDTRQVEGRTNRDGRSSVIHYAYAEGTVEEAMCLRIVERMAAMEGMAGDDTSLVEALAAAIEERMGQEGRRA